MERREGRTLTFQTWLSLEPAALRHHGLQPALWEWAVNVPGSVDGRALCVLTMNYLLRQRPESSSRRQDDHKSCTYLDTSENKEHGCLHSLACSTCHKLWRDTQARPKKQSSVHTLNELIKHYPRLSEFNTQSFWSNWLVHGSSPHDSIHWLYCL